MTKNYTSPCNAALQHFLQTTSYEHSHARVISTSCTGICFTIKTKTSQAYQRMQRKTVWKRFLIQNKGQIRHFHEDQCHFQFSLSLGKNAHQSERLCEEGDPEPSPWKPCGWVGCWLYHFQVRMTPICGKQHLFPIQIYLLNDYSIKFSNNVGDLIVLLVFRFLFSFECNTIFLLPLPLFMCLVNSGVVQKASVCRRAFTHSCGVHTGHWTCHIGHFSK